jgi:hypothetical protein
MVLNESQSGSSLPTAVSSLRFVVWIAVVTAGCLAWYGHRYAISTPTLGMNWVLLRPRSELFGSVVPKNSSIPSLVVGVGVALGVISLIHWLGEFISSHVDPITAERIGTHPATIGSAWFLVLYAGARAWKRQVVGRDA